MVVSNNETGIVVQVEILLMNQRFTHLTLLCNVGWWVTTTFQFTDCYDGSKYTSCKMSFDAISESDTKSATLVSFSAVGILAVGLLLYSRKKRAARIDLRREESLAERQGHAIADFEMMADMGVRV